MTPAQPGTPQAFLNSLIAPNAQENISINGALKYASFLAQLGLGYDSIVAQQTDQGDGPANEYPIAQLKAMAVDASVPICMNGIAKGTQYNIGLETILIAGFDGLNTYQKIYALRNPGASEGDALAALVNLPIVAGPMVDTLNKLKASAGLA
jgi:hypothetical protein